jgi:hypothetical protein
MSLYPTASRKDDGCDARRLDLSSPSRSIKAIRGVIGLTRGDVTSWLGRTVDTSAGTSWLTREERTGVTPFRMGGESDEDLCGASRSMAPRPVGDPNPFVPAVEARRRTHRSHRPSGSENETSSFGLTRPRSSRKAHSDACRSPATSPSRIPRAIRAPSAPLAPARVAASPLASSGEKPRSVSRTAATAGAAAGAGYVAVVAPGGGGGSTRAHASIRGGRCFNSDSPMR